MLYSKDDIFRIYASPHGKAQKKGRQGPEKSRNGPMNYVTQVSPVTKVTKSPQYPKTREMPQISIISTPDI